MPPNKVVCHQKNLFLRACFSNDAASMELKLISFSEKSFLIFVLMANLFQSDSSFWWDKEQFKNLFTSQEIAHNFSDLSTDCG